MTPDKKKIRHIETKTQKIGEKNTKNSFVSVLPQSWRTVCVCVCACVRANQRIVILFL